MQINYNKNQNKVPPFHLDHAFRIPTLITDPVITKSIRQSNQNFRKSLQKYSQSQKEDTIQQLDKIKQIQIRLKNLDLQQKQRIAETVERIQQRLQVTVKNKQQFLTKRREKCKKHEDLVNKKLSLKKYKSITQQDQSKQKIKEYDDNIIRYQTNKLQTQIEKQRQVYDSYTSKLQLQTQDSVKKFDPIKQCRSYTNWKDKINLVQKFLHQKRLEKSLSTSKQYNKRLKEILSRSAKIRESKQVYNFNKTMAKLDKIISKNKNLKQKKSQIKSHQTKKENNQMKQCQSCISKLNRKSQVISEHDHQKIQLSRQRFLKYEQKRKQMDNNRFIKNQNYMQDYSKRKNQLRISKHVKNRLIEKKIYVKMNFSLQKTQIDE